MKFFFQYIILIFIFVFTLMTNASYTQEISSPRLITFKSKDALPVSAYRWDVSNPKAVILLFHQAGSSKGEYLDIAPWLAHMGYIAIAVDLRSGEQMKGVVNQTALEAKKKKLPRSYGDAIQDIQASISYARNTYSTLPLYIWGSSYSSSLVLVIASQSKEVDAVFSFSPGEYFSAKGSSWVQDNAKKLNIPIFITAAKSEIPSVKKIYLSIASVQKTLFIPNGAGRHGSSALWESEKDEKEYRTAVKLFLDSLEVD